MALTAGGLAGLGIRRDPRGFFSVCISVQFFGDPDAFLLSSCRVRVHIASEIGFERKAALCPRVQGIGVACTKGLKPESPNQDSFCCIFNDVTSGLSCRGRGE